MFTNIDLERVPEALTAHLDSLAGIVKWILLYAVVFWLAGLQCGGGSIDALGMKIDRASAFWVGLVTYVVINIAVIVTVWRLGDLIALLAPTDTLNGVTRVGVHSWEMNPFAFYDPAASIYTRVLNSFGLGILHVVWWLAASSLVLPGFHPVKEAQPWIWVLVLFLPFGVAAGLGIFRVYRNALGALEGNVPSIGYTLQAMGIYRGWSWIMGIVLGVGLFVFAINIWFENGSPISHAGSMCKAVLDWHR